MPLCALQRLAATASQPCVVWEAATALDGAGGRNFLVGTELWRWAVHSALSGGKGLIPTRHFLGHFQSVCG